MNMFNTIKQMTIDELAEWLDKYGAFDGSPWMKWWDDKYCGKCDAEVVFVPAFNKETECCWCELYHKCKYFQDMNEVPGNMEVIKMWLESNV